MKIAGNRFLIVKDFPGDAKWGLGLQISRSAISIPSNIAEGCGRESPKETGRYIEIATGSTFELETQLLLALEAKFGSLPLIEETLSHIVAEGKMLVSFGKSLNKNGKPPKT